MKAAMHISSLPFASFAPSRPIAWRRTITAGITAAFALFAGAAAQAQNVALAGMLKASTWQAKDGTARPSLDLQADEVASTTPRPRKPKAQAGGAPAGDPFGDMPGAGDVDCRGAAHDCQQPWGR